MIRRLLSRIVGYLWSKFVGAPIQGHHEDEEIGKPPYAQPVMGGTMTRNEPKK